MTIRQSIQKLDPGARVELFDLDLTGIGGAMYRFHAGTNASLASIVWKGNTYTPWPIEASGFELNGRGQNPTPRLRVSNIGGVITSLCVSHADMVGSKITRRRTLAKYLDGAPAADPTAEFPLDVFYVERKVSETRVVVEFELSAASDVEGVMLPRRQIVVNVCPWTYRSSECSYAGGAVAKADDTATTVLAEDVCGKRVASCKLRFGATNPLPYGGFPGARVTV